MAELENRMLIDSEWNEVEYGVAAPKPRNPLDDIWEPQEDIEDDYGESYEDI